MGKAHSNCPKKSGALKICADYKVTMNKNLDKMFYSLPTMDGILHKLQGVDVTDR